MKARHPITLVAAVARNGIIGHDGRMPWRLPGDLAHFRSATLGRPLLMGRRTFESIGRPLPGRTSIVLSRDQRFAPPGVTVAHTLADGRAAADAAADDLGADRVMVVGGGQVYAALIADADCLLITAVDLAPDGGTSFPTIDPRRWRLAVCRVPTRVPGDSARYRIEHWIRQRPSPVGAEP